MLARGYLVVDDPELDDPEPEEGWRTGGLFLLPGGPATPTPPPAAGPVDGFTFPPAAVPEVVPEPVELPLLLEPPLVPPCAIAAGPKASRPAQTAAVI